MRLVMPLGLQSQIKLSAGFTPRLATTLAGDGGGPPGRFEALNPKAPQGFARVLLHANERRCQLDPDETGAGWAACAAGLAVCAGAAAGVGAEALAAWT